jgi:hypothetical protein
MIYFLVMFQGPMWEKAPYGVTRTQKVKQMAEYAIP